MNDLEKPIVLIVDDRDDDGRLLADKVKSELEVRRRSPDDLLAEDLTDVSLLLVDLDLEDWSILAAPDSRAIAETPLDGLALAAVLRGHLGKRTASRVTAVALYSNQVEQLAGRLPVEVRDHVLARIHDLEWVFEKLAPHLARDVIALAQGVSQLPTDWPEDPDVAVDVFRKLLAVPDDDDSLPAWREVENAHPPIHEVTDVSHTLALVRWMAQRIVPYPSFLLSEPYVAARFGITRAALEQLLGREGEHQAELEKCQYRGFLAGFGGIRWWAAELERLVWQWTDGTLDMDALRLRLEESAKMTLDPVPAGSVVTIGANYQPESEACAVEEAVRVQPDDWPPFAAQAWARIELVVGDDQLRALVLEDDQRLIDSHA